MSGQARRLGRLPLIEKLRGLAALLSGVFEAQGRVGVVISGGNVDAETMAAILEERV